MGGEGREALGGDLKGAVGDDDGLGNGVSAVVLVYCYCYSSQLAFRLAAVLLSCTHTDEWVLNLQ